MKKITLLFISVFALQSLFSQVVLTNSLNFEIGDTYQYNGYSDVTSIDPGPGGANLVWDFSSISGGNYFEGNEAICVDPSTTVFADSAAVVNSNICIRNLENPDIGPYQYYDCNSTSQNLIALGFLGTGNNTLSTYTNVQTALEFPFAYGNSFDDTWESLMFHIDLGYYFMRDSSIVTIEADAYGTITTPVGEYQNVLRLKRATTDYSWANYGSGWIPLGSFTDTQYEWFAADIKVPVMIMQEMEGLPGFTVRYLAEYSFPTRIEDMPDNRYVIFPNPTTDRVIIKTDKAINRVSIYSIAGRQLDVVDSQTGRVHQQTTDLSSYPEGIYLMKIEFEDGNIATERIVKQ